MKVEYFECVYRYKVFKKNFLKTKCINNQYFTELEGGAGGFGGGSGSEFGSGVQGKFVAKIP